MKVPLPKDSTKESASHINKCDPVSSYQPKQAARGERLSGVAKNEDIQNPTHSAKKHLRGLV